MKISALYSHKNGERILRSQYQTYFQEIITIIERIDAEKCREEPSPYAAPTDPVFYNPMAFNQLYSQALLGRQWNPRQVEVTTPTIEPDWEHHAIREVEFVKDKIGIEVRPKDYAWLVYDVFSKMVLFNKRGLLNIGIKILPMQSMAEEMPAGLGYFEQIVGELYQRGESNIDIPILLIGVAPAS